MAREKESPDAAHYPVTLACLKAGKHVLCEKQLAPNARDAERMRRAASTAGVVNMVNFSYHDWPAIQVIAQRVREGAIGAIRHVETSYLQSWLAGTVQRDWRETLGPLWKLSSAHGIRGVLGDASVHIIDFATFPCGPVRDVHRRKTA